MIRTAIVAAAATVLLGASAVAAAAPAVAAPAAATSAATTSATDKGASGDVYVAHIDSRGVDGNVKVDLNAEHTGGTITWTLHGLDNGNVTIRMDGGTCADPTNFVGTAWTHDAVFPDGNGSRTHELPTESAEAFAADIAGHHGVTATVRNNEQFIACVPFTDKV